MAAPVTVGELKDQWIIQRPVESNHRGEMTTTATTVATVWCKVEPLTGREYDRAASVQGEITHRVWMRYRSDLTTVTGECWLVNSAGTRTLRFLHPPRNHMEEGVWWVVDCAERTT